MRGQKSHVAARTFCGVALVLGIVFASVHLQSAASSPAGGRATQARDVSAVTGAGTVSVTVDDVAISVDAPWINQPFIAPPADGLQVATAMQPHPYRELSITSMPYGYPPATEALPAPTQGSVSTLRASLASDRQQEGAVPIGSPTASMFGQQIVGAAYDVTGHFSSTVPQEVVISGGLSGADILTEIQQVALSSSDLTTATALAVPPEVVQVSANAVPTPPWWSGACDDTHYYAGSQQLGWPVHSYQLAPGAVFQGLVACGPRPYYNEGPDVLVRFFSGAVGEYEFECVELSMRWLYQQYGITPYVANGSQVVWNYNGTALQKVANGTTGQVPAAGDVLSYGSTSTNGHTSVVTGAQVNASGNGSVSVIEENASSTGTESLTVSGWTIQDSTAVSGWLHDPTAGGGTPPAFTADTPPSTAMAGDSWSYTFTATGSPPPTFSVSNGALPPGLSLNGTTGVLSGTPSATGAFMFNIAANNTAGSAITPSITVVVSASPAAILVRPSGEADVVVRAPDNSLTYYWSPTGQPFNAISVAGPGTAFSAPAMVLRSSGEVDIVAEGPNNSLYYWWNPQGGPFNLITAGGAGTTYSAPAVAFRSGTEADIVAEGPNNSLYYWWNPQGGPFNLITDAGAGTTYSAPSIAMVSGTDADIVAEGPSNALNYWWNLPGGAFNLIGAGGAGSTYSAPSIAIRGTNEAD